MPGKQKGQSKTIASHPNDVFYRKLLILIPVLTFLVYLRVLGQQYLNFDDDWYIYESPYVAGFTWDRLTESFTQPYQGQYSPLPQLYLALLFKLGGGQPFLMKLSALLIHILNSLLVFRLIHKLINEYRGAFFVSALFALHPIHVESVAWLTEIFKISACFSLVAMLLYLKFLEKRKGIYYAGVMLMLALSFLSREQAVLLPLSLVLMDYLRGRKLLSKQVIAEKLPFFLMALALGVLTVRLVVSHHGPSPYDITFGDKLYLVSLAFGSYLQKLLLPVGLSFAYIYPTFTEGLKPEQVALPVLVLAGLILMLVALRKDRIGPFGLLFFIANLSASLLSILVSVRDTFMADRYTYLASVGFFLALYSLLGRWLKRSPSSKNVIKLAVLTYLVVLSVVTYRRTVVFSNPETLWTDAIKKNPQNWYAYHNRGYFYRTIREYQKAIHDYQGYINLNPRFPIAYYNLGEIYFELGDMKKALYYTNEAIRKHRLTRREGTPSEDLDAYNNRAAIYASINKLDKALADLDFVLTNDPRRVDALANRSLVLFNLGEYRKCLGDLERLLNHNPKDARSLNLVGLCYMGLGDMRNAISFLDKAINLNPQNGGFWLDRSRAYSQAQNRTKALADALQAQRLGASVDAEYIDGLRN